MPRYWLSLFFGYNGSGYNGMQHQKQSHVLSVQNQLLPLLYKSNFLPTDNYTQLQRRYKYSRAARTDKGVHAVLNGFSCQFTIDKKFFDQDSTLDAKKLHLAFVQCFQGSKIVFHCFKKVTTRFEMRHVIQSRKYAYICPFKYFEQQGKSPQQTLQKINQCSRQYIGTHNFHNYSRDLKAKDPQAKRYIISFTAQLYGPSNQFVKFIIQGQSFVYNQIRKMIGGIVLVFVNNYLPQFIGNTFFRNQFYLPIAPAEGLYLKLLDFKGYNNKKEIPQKLEFDQQGVKKTMDQLEKEIEEFIFVTDQEKWMGWYNLVKEGKVIVPMFQFRNQPEIGQAA